jgi:predicted DNA-binding ribbon-helix-helix protein
VDVLAMSKVVPTGDPDALQPSVKYSVTIAGHPTSLRLEPLFWRALNEEAKNRGVPLNALLAQIDAERLARAPSPNLASAVRLWLYAKAQAQHDRHNMA